MKFLTFIQQSEIHPGTTEKVIPAKDFSVLLETKMLIEHAQEDIALYKQKVEKRVKNYAPKQNNKALMRALSNSALILQI